MMQNPGLPISSRWSTLSRKVPPKGKSMIYLKQLQEILYTNNECRLSWIKELPVRLESHGFSVKVADRMREPKWHRTTMTHLVCGVIDEISRRAVEKVGASGTGEKLRETIRAAIQENLEGSYLSSLFQVVVAQKPA